MTDLYGSKWESQQGPPEMENGAYSPTFLLWCRKTEHLTDEAWKHAFHQLEYEVKEASRMGEEIWPPSYAGFIGKSERAHGELAHKYFPPIGLPDKTAQERAKAAGEKEMRKLRSLFSDI